MIFSLIFRVVVLILVMSSPGWAGFPQLEATATTHVVANTLTPTVNLPACAAGNLLIVLGGGDTTVTTIAWPGSWTELLDEQSSDFVGNIVVAYLESTGAESTVQPTFSGTADQSSWIAYCISGWDTNTPPEIGTTAESAFEGHPDPPSLSPSWGAEDTFWIAFGTHRNSSISLDQFSVAPTNYINLINSDSPNNSTPPSVGSAHRLINAASQDPGAFTVLVPDDAESLANTIAIRPAPISASKPKVIFIQ